MREEAGELQPVPTRTNEETAGEPARRETGLQCVEPGVGKLSLTPPPCARTLRRAGHPTRCSPHSQTFIWVLRMQFFPN